MSAELWKLLGESLWETIYMVVVSGTVSAVLGIPLGVLLYVTRESQILARPTLHKILGIVVNATRSIPFIILMVAVIPFTRLIIGTSIGTTAAIVPLSLAGIPFVARIAEGALDEISTGLIEAAQSMGATPMQIITKVMLPEALPGLIHGMTLTLVTMVSYSAMAGAIGGGGLGDLGIRYGYQRFDPTVMLITVVILIAVVQLIQSGGELLQRRFIRK